MNTRNILREDCQSQTLFAKGCHLECSSLVGDVGWAKRSVPTMSERWARCALPTLLFNKLVAGRSFGLKSRPQDDNSFWTKLFFSCLFFWMCLTAFADEPPKLGNFALPTSQQPGPLLSYGQTNIGKNQIQPFLLATEYKGVNQSYFTASPAALFGITDNLTALLGTPIAVNYSDYGAHSSGVQDTLAGFEYAFYNENNACFSDQATVFSYLSFPTGSAQKNPITGFGATSIYLGWTVSRTFVDWYLFQSDSVLLTGMKNGTKFGNQFFYQFGLSRVINSTKDWIFSCLLEIDGNFLDKDRRDGFIDPDSGGNIVYATPSLWFSNQKFIFQFGIGAPFIQKLNGEQSHTQYLVAGSLSYTIDGLTESKP